MPRKCLGKQSAARRCKGSSPKSITRRSVKSLTVTKKRHLDAYSREKHGARTDFCRSKGIPYKTAYFYLNSGKHSEREELRSQIVKAVERLIGRRRGHRQHRNISAAAIIEEIGPKKCTIGVRQVNRIIATLFKGSRPRRVRPGAANAITSIESVKIGNLFFVEF